MYDCWSNWSMRFIATSNFHGLDWFWGDQSSFSAATAVASTEAVPYKQMIWVLKLTWANTEEYPSHKHISIIGAAPPYQTKGPGILLPKKYIYSFISGDKRRLFCSSHTHSSCATTNALLFICIRKHDLMLKQAGEHPRNPSFNGTWFTKNTHQWFFW